MGPVRPRAHRTERRSLLDSSAPTLPSPNGGRVLLDVARPACQAARETLAWCGRHRAGAGVHQLIDARRHVIRKVASRHQVTGLRWWLPSANAVCLDLVVEGRSASVPAFRSDLESALGCRVAIYLADQIPQEAWGRMLVRTVAL